MKEINIDINRCGEGQLLSHRISNIELWQLGKVIFYLRAPVEDNILYAFASPALGRFIVANDKVEIHDVKLTIEHTLPGRTDEAKRLHLTLQTREIVTLSEDGLIYRAQPLHPRPLEYTGRLLSPQKIWGGSPMSYLGLILISERMFDTVEDLANNGNQLELIEVLWMEFQRELKADPQKTGNYKIAGEFMAFSALRLPGRLFVLFDL
ncbi:hypothetical protein DDZ13_05545 [Coraliomargarita sinensis]|uniref:Uncharacterized protein n=1 Tax=Coraliomargarita sinensis TaxID=2174842 RepID=A0A317ZKB9_9BACT|nr:hypothetical protein [Coraliomargarita sinensis]PXA04637.1 hypothetical protein DDZ13_05545 [Coraliomargarita sinensis]